MNIIIAILIFGLIIFIHEVGHFVLAKFNGVFVTEFSMGMGKRLISFIPTNEGYKFRGLLSDKEFEEIESRREKTVYSLKLLPFGGSCMMLGEDENINDNRAFNKKGVWARISVIFAGAFFNFILAFVLSLAVISILGYDPAIITGVNKDSAAYQAGLREGDKIVKINNRRIHVSREASSYFLFSPLSDEEVKITYERDGKEDTAMLTPQYKENYILGFTYMPDSSPATIESLYEGYPMDKAGLMPGDIIVGFNGSRIESGEQLTNYLYQNPLDKSQVELEFLRDGKEQVVEVTPEYAGEGYELGYTIRYGYVDASPLEVIKYSLVEIKYNISVAIRSFGMLITGRAGANDIAGPVGIVNIIGDTYEASKAGGGLIVFINLASLTIMLSANVGVINLFPLPALDGGRLVFLFLELIRRKPIPAEKEGMVHFVGIMALMFLMVFVLFNDIRKILPF